MAFPPPPTIAIAFLKMPSLDGIQRTYEMVGGIEVEKVATASQSKSSTVWI
jgi:hypothetical protein